MSPSGLRDGQGEWWRTLDERAGDPAFRERLQNEFPSLLPDLDALADPVARRKFLKLMGASVALAGLTACTRQPAEKIVPYVRQPEEIVPGRPLYFATAMTLGGVATGLLVESHEGRPTKIEGNPLHPGSVGATDIFAQAAILDLYDPDRSQTLLNLGEIRPWPRFLGAIRSMLQAQSPIGGSGLRILTETVSSPTLAAQIRDLLARYPNARWHQWDAVSDDNARTGARLAFGRYVGHQYRFENADLVLALDADVLSRGPGCLRYTRDFSARRRPEAAAGMSRLYAIESAPSSTGARADHRLPMRPRDIEVAARLIAAGVGVANLAADSSTLSESARRWIDAVVRDLRAQQGRSLVIAGEGQPPSVHALTHGINAALGNAGRTVVYTEPVEAEPTDQLQSLRTLAADMTAGRVDALLILGGNPAYTAPADLQFAAAMSKVPFCAHLSLYDDETSALCHWHIPEAHFLESWSDARAYDGTVSIVQPLIAPLYDGKSAHELMAATSDRPGRSGYDIVREYWMQKTGLAANRTTANDRTALEFEATWRQWLHDGVVPDTAFTPAAFPLAAREAAIPSERLSSTDLDLVFRNDPSVLDGRFANNGWLQELPKPLTKLTWDNAVLVSPATAGRLMGEYAETFEGGELVSDVVEIRHRGRMVRGPLFVVVGHADDCLTVHMGYGRTRGGRHAVGAGFNAHAIRTTDEPWFATDVQVVKTGDRLSLACTQYHHLMEGRNMVRAATRDAFLRDPQAVHESPGIEAMPPRTLTLYPEWKYEGYKWGMAIDINACTGCNACVIGCQAENNIPVVGKAEVLRGREMHWIRVDSYYRGSASNPETYFQPVPCMHCENAPCELVCPVGATVHSHEGLNDMVYNRCVGTRYCSNNCPYKVRRFNFLLYQDWETPSLKLVRNPDVTVRSRGVMEKCTYCVQRINAAKIETERQDRRIRDGEVVTACQQACPAEAIVFGDLNDPNSRVARLQAEVRNYALLGELNTRPRTTYLAAIRNVNPELVD
ncbi:MAG TPA: TAT-variant-translocated molybdopterin oxidoreductase [Vicinamibacterales bacterium]|nr:TAT-variant-translocated molybdopterin oxidoreductase [Vicinamibacterales bacterium]